MIVNSSGSANLFLNRIFTNFLVYSVWTPYHDWVCPSYSCSHSRSNDELTGDEVKPVYMSGRNVVFLSRDVTKSDWASNDCNWISDVDGIFAGFCNLE